MDEESQGPTPEEREVIRQRLSELCRAVEEQTALLRPLCALCDKVGIERVDWAVLVEIAARTEMLRRLNQEVARGFALLGEDPPGAAN